MFVFGAVVRKSPENTPLRIQRQNVCAEIRGQFVCSPARIGRVLQGQSQRDSNKFARLSLHPRDFQPQQKQIPFPRSALPRWETAHGVCLLHRGMVQAEA